MTKEADLHAIHAAELRLVEAKQHTLESGRRVWLGIKAGAARPSILAAFAAVGLCGGWLIGRSRKAPEPAKTAETAETDSFASIIFALALRSAARLLPVVVSRVWAEQRKEEPCTTVNATVIRDQDGTTRVL